MHSNQFKVVFKGELLSAFDVAEVKKSFGQRFNLDAIKLEQLFSGVTVVLKKNITSEQALKYHEKFKALGLITYVKEENSPTDTTKK